VSSQRNKVLGEQDTWVSKLTSVHVDQIYPTETGTGEYKPTLFRILVVTMSIALLLTVALGIFLAFRSPSRAWLVALSFLVGILLPAAFLWLGQPK
jgi:hypothetical protein